MLKEVLNSVPTRSETYFLIDCGAYLISYLKYRLHTYNNANITPFAKILELYFNITDHNPNARFLFFVDNGILTKIKDMYSAYKSNRKHSIHRSENVFIASNPLKSNEYVVNRTLICKFFFTIGEAVYYYNEADYQLGSVLKKLITKYSIDPDKIYVISHDNDLMSLIEYSNCILKYGKSKKYDFPGYHLYQRGDYTAYTPDFNISNYTEYIIMKSLMGDDLDNVMKPIMIESRFVKKMLNKYKYDYGYFSLDLEKTFTIIKDKILNKVKDSTEYENIEKQLAIQLKRNYIIFDIYNSENLFKADEINFMNVTTDAKVRNLLNKNYDQARDILLRVSRPYLEVFDKWLHRYKKS